MSDDDDTGHHHSKIVAQAEEVGNKPVTLKLWVVAVIAIAAFIAGAWLF